MRFSLIIAAFFLSACVMPIEAKKNPNVAKRPTSTKKFLESKDYYLPEEEAQIAHTPEPKETKKPYKPKTSAYIDDSVFEEFHDEISIEPEKPLYDEEGLASWYGPGFHGRKTANGESFDQYELTAAHRKLPMGSKVEVTNLANGKTVTVRINDRGPYAGKRIIDLSKAAAKELGIINHGVAKVRVKQVEE